MTSGSRKRLIFIRFVWRVAVRKGWTEDYTVLPSAASSSHTLQPARMLPEEISTEAFKRRSPARHVRSRDTRRTRSLLQIGAPLLRFVNVADGNSPGLLLRQIRSGIQRIRRVKTIAASAFASSWR